MQSKVIRSEIVINWKKVLTSVLKKWWLILLCFLFGAAAGFGIGTYTDKPVYESNATYVLSYSGENNVSAMTAEYSFISKLLYNCTEIVKQNTFFNLIAENLNEGLSEGAPNYIDPVDLSKCVNYTYSGNGGTLIYISVQTDNAQLSYNIIKEITNNFSEYILSQYQLAGGDDMIFNLVSTLEVPEKPIESTIRSTFTVLGAVAVAFICVAIICLKALANDKIQSVADINGKYEAPILGSIPTFEEK